jgi:hypothetical protein
MKKTGIIIVITAVIIILQMNATYAEPITFIYESTGSGTIGGTAFGASIPVPITITATSDTDLWEPFVTQYDAPFYSTFYGWSAEHIKASIEIDGVNYNFETKTQTLVFDYRIFDNFPNIPVDSDMIQFAGMEPLGRVNVMQVNELDNWDRLSSFGPVTTSLGFLFGEGTWLGLELKGFELETTGGSLLFDSKLGDAVITFEATVTPVPEPTSLFLLGTGLGALGLAAYRRKRI